MKRIAWSVYNFFRGPIGYTGPMGLDGQPGKPGVFPVEWENRLDRLYARVEHLEMLQAERTPDDLS